MRTGTADIIKDIKKLKRGRRKRLSELAGITYPHLINMANGYANITEEKEQKIRAALTKMEKEKDL